MSLHKKSQRHQWREEPGYSLVRKALQDWPQEAVKYLAENIKGRGGLSQESWQHILDLTGFDAKHGITELLPVAALWAKPPISNYHVGAVVLGESGSVYFGANLEFPGLPLSMTVHAEQAAVAHSWSCGETAIQALAINAPPCGYCRQFLNELGCRDVIKIYLPDREPMTVGDLLPDAFGPAHLGIQGGMMDNAKQTSDFAEGASDDQEVSSMTCTAAAESWAPYSSSYSAVTLLCDDGSKVVGRYCENAAFNPSFAPMQMAFSLLNMRGRHPGQIQKAWLAESRLGQISQESLSRLVLDSLSDVTLEVGHLDSNE